MVWPVIFALSLVTFSSGEETCLSGDENPYLLFGTKTAYIFSNTGSSNLLRAHEVPGCQPTAIWLLSRHGSHSPESNEHSELMRLSDLRDNIISNYKAANLRTDDRMCVSDLNLLAHWSWGYGQNLSDAGDLTSDGYMTTVQLAQAWKQKFPGLFTDDAHNYMFQFVNEPRSRNTFKAFSVGVFGSNPIFDLPTENDEKLLRPYKFCPAWIRDVETNNDTMMQLNIFMSKSEYKEMISNISRRLGFNYDMEVAIVQRMYQMCRYDKAMDVTQISPWCAAFTTEDLKRLEYAEDLETYYKYGYGSDMNEKVGCTSVKDLVEFFSKHVTQGSGQPRVRVQLADAAQQLVARAALGAGRGAAPPTGDNYRARGASARSWATSLVAPFNANIAAVLYKCTQNGNFQVKDEYQVLLMENEKPMLMEGCKVGLCDWSLIKAKLGAIADACQLDFCNGASSVNSVVALSIALIAFVTRYIVL